ncbi:phosphoglycerate mutase [Xylaria flabelliformis]|nr:phosphoglycerate mutase [Xylaria flabelliformis]
MGRPPAYIFVVRHGNRLDAADKQWHLTSPTPYDPPLTYGGWMHSRRVGARIAAILRDDVAAEAASEPSSSPSPSPSAPKRRRFRIIIHSSPFLRCVQTSIAISAGLASNPASSSTPSNLAEPVPSRPGTLRLTQASSFSNSAPTKSRPDVTTSISTPVSTAPHEHGGEGHIFEKSVLRLDAFLGEWLSPEYFEHITPPPESALMLATAKAELLRRSSYHDYPHYHHRIHSSASSHLWGNLSGHSHSGDLGTPEGHSTHGTSAFDTMSNLAGSLPDLGGHTNGNSNHAGAQGAAHGHRRAHGYVYPVPSYAISTSEPIPRGYVGHARDACVSVDYQWDSSRESLAWGDGGMLPEEWASMHQRFRRGLRRLVDWYGSTENPGHMVTRMAHSSQAPESEYATDGDQDNEVEDVVVLVSHGAGCNALIGAITQQPVLADVAMSSLTMAQRRAGFDSQNISLTRQKSLSSLDTAHLMSRATFPEMYDLKLFANTDHLVTNSTTTHNRAASLSRPNIGPRVSAGYTSALKEINFGSHYGNSSGNSSGNTRDQSANASLGSMRRSSGGGTVLAMRPPVYNTTSEGVTVGSGISSFSVTRPDRSGSGTWGLWSPRQDDKEQDEEPETPMFLNFSHEKPAVENRKAEETKHKGEEPATSLIDPDKLACATSTIIDGKRTSSENCVEDEQTSDQYHEEEHDNFNTDAVPHLRTGTGNGGLWGAPTPPGDAERLRDFSSSKRRWTVTER